MKGERDEISVDSRSKRESTDFWNKRKRTSPPRSRARRARREYDAMAAGLGCATSGVRAHAVRYGRNCPFAAIV